MISAILRQKRWCIVENSLDDNETIMIPDYLKFIRYQDKRLIPYLYFVTLFLLGLYWKNNGYTLASGDAWRISAVLSLITFNCIYELKDYWAYKCAIKNIDFSYFHDKPTSRYEAILWQPTVVIVLCLLGFYLAVKSCLLLLSPVSASLCIALISPLLIYLIFRFARYNTVKQMKQASAQRVKYKNLHSYVCFNVGVTFFMTCLVVSPLASHEDFSVSEGFFSARLMIAMLILCIVVLIINLVFTRASKRYIFLGRLFLKEFDFQLSKSIPLCMLHEWPVWVRLMALFILQSLWIIAVNIILSLTGWDIYFGFYFFLCILPSGSYFYLHVYWLWHNDFMVACDMFLRCDGIDRKLT